MDDQIRLLNTRGRNDTQIAHELGRSVSFVNRRRNKMDLPVVPTPSSSWQKIDEADLRRLHGRGLVDRQIAEELGVSREAVQKRRDALGLSPNGWQKRP